MCIRDRVNASFVGEPDDADAHIVLHSGIHIGLAVSTDAGPVSYTHLRAHETVLDLVCRLLLEKKKSQPPQT